MDFTSDSKKLYMQLALAEAKKAAAKNEVPIGAIIINPEGKVIGRGYNRRELDQLAMAHAEMIALKRACQNLGSWRLVDCSLFVTLEPCPMCAGAIINSRIANVFYGAPDPKAGAAGSVTDLFKIPKFNHHPLVVGGLYRKESSQLMKNFFQEIRQQQKIKKLKKVEND